jgi:uncharacterized membrane protein
LFIENYNRIEKRPIIFIKPTRKDQIIEMFDYLILLAFWIAIIAAFKDLPEKIPIHYDRLGEVDNYSAKTSIFL